MKAGKRRQAKSKTSPSAALEAGAPARVNASVLVVDDEKMISKVVGRGLTAAGCEVTYAANGEEALSRLREALPDVVISDVNMPRMNGFELLTRIRAQSTTRALPVILLSARGETEDVVAGMGLGADDYVIKPFAMPELLARVRAKVELTNRNSLVKMPNGGRPAIATTPATNDQPSSGWVAVRPLMSAILWLPFTWAMWPTTKKIPDLVRLCMVMCSSPAKLASGPPMPKANAMMPMCSIEE